MKISAIMCACASVAFGLGAAWMFGRDTLHGTLTGIVCALLSLKWALYAIGYVFASFGTDRARGA